jgi:TPR repeat protein
MKTLIVHCDFNGVNQPVEFFYGMPNPNRHPIFYQAWYVNRFRGGEFPDDVMNYLKNIHDKVKLNNLDFEDFCYSELRVEYKPVMSVDKTQLDETSIEKIVALMFSKITSFVFVLPEEPDFYETLEASYHDNFYSKAPKYYILGLNAERQGNINEAVEYFTLGEADLRASRKLIDLGINIDTDDKIRSILNSILLGDIESLYRLAVGLDTSPDYERVLARIRYECEKRIENAQSTVTLGILSMIFEPNSVTNAIRYFERGKKLKYPSSSFYLGLIYERGLGAEEINISKAIDYYADAVNMNHLNATHKLIELYNFGKSSYPYQKIKMNNINENMWKSKANTILYSEKGALFEDAIAYANLAFHFWHSDDGDFSPEKARINAEKALFCNDQNSDINQLDSVLVGDLYELLGNYYYYFKSKDEKCLEYYARAAKAGKPIGDLVVGVCKFFKSSAKNQPGVLKREYFENLIYIGESLIGNDENKVPYYLLAYAYAKGLKKNLLRAKNYLKKSYQFNKERVRNDLENSDPGALYRLGKIIDMNLLHKPNEDSLVYYQRATKCKTNSFMSRLYKNKAQQQIENLFDKPKTLLASTISLENYELAFSDETAEKPYTMISFADENLNIAKIIQNAYQIRDLATLVDYRNSGEKALDESILYIENSSIIIVCISKAYQDSEYCKKEISHSVLISRKSLIPVLVEKNFKPHSWLMELLEGKTIYEITDNESLNANIEIISNLSRETIIKESIRTQICKIS